MLRISATIPDDLIAAADERARVLDRSRSWVLAEALRQYLSRPSVPEQVSEQPVHPYEIGPSVRSGLGEYRRLQLRADLSLSPEARVKEAERTLRLSDRGRQPVRDRVVTFDSFDDYLEWDRREGLLR